MWFPQIIFHLATITEHLSGTVLVARNKAVKYKNKTTKQTKTLSLEDNL